MFPEPEAARPIEVLLFVQLNVAPEILLPKEIDATLSPLQYEKSLITLTVGVGLTVIVKLLVGPGHPFAVGVIVMFDVIEAVLVLVAVNEGILPDPFAANPIEVFEFVHANVVPVTGPDKLIKVVLWLLQ
jgi:hypothetical protein